MLIRDSHVNKVFEKFIELEKKMIIVSPTVDDDI